MGNNGAARIGTSYGHGCTVAGATLRCENSAPLTGQPRASSAGKEETQAGRRRLLRPHPHSLVNRKPPPVNEARLSLVTMLYPSAEGCNHCYRTLHGIGCGVTGPVLLEVSDSST